MKSEEEVELEGSVEAIGNAQKCIHLDTGGRGDHVPLAQRVRSAKTLEEASLILVKAENDRMKAIRGAMWPRLNMVKKRLRLFK